jgi:rod shape-determining protein MreD
MSHVWTGTGPGRGRRRGDRLQVAVVVLILLGLEFYLRPSLIAGKGMPDLLLLVMVLLAIRTSPGKAALIGLVGGFVMDVLTPAHFGANILAHVLVGFSAAAGRAVFFPDHLLVNAGLFFIATWVRNLLVVTLAGTSLAAFGAEALMWAPLQGLTTAMVGTVIILLFRDWLAIRIES